MRFRRIIRYFKRGNVSVCGLRGRGKDMLMANVVVRRRKPYVSNVDYGGEFIRFDPNLINLSGNTYKSFCPAMLFHTVFRTRTVPTSISLMLVSIFLLSTVLSSISSFRTFLLLWLLLGI